MIRYAFPQIRRVVCGAWVVLHAVSLGLASNSNVGTSGATFLKLDGDARSSAMGGAFVGIADDVNAIRYNASGLASVEEKQFSATHAQWFQDMKVNQGAVVLPTNVGTFGFSALTLKVDNLQKRGTDEGYQGDFDAMDASYNVSYGRKIFDRLLLGGTARLIKQSIDSYSATTVGGDVGVLHRQKKGPLSLGLAVRNFGEKVKFDNDADPQPLTVDLGLGGFFLDEKLVVGVHAEKPRDNDINFGVGGEWNHPMGKDLRGSFRVGYRNSATDPTGANGISMGCGLRIKRVGFDFAYEDFGDLGNIFKYSLRVNF